MTQQQDAVQYISSEQAGMSPQEKQHPHSQAMKILISNVQCEVILPEDPAYETERKVWNGSADCYPAAIVRCVDAEDVRIAVNFAF